MKAPLGRFCLLLCFFTATVMRAGEVTPVSLLEDGSYRVTVKATHKFTRNTGKLKDEALAAATQFCTKDGKQLKVLSVIEDKNQYLVGDFAQVTLTFRALAAGELEPAPVTAAPPAPKPMSTDELGAELTKLNDLRKQGLLSDAEFEALKQKLLNRF